MFASTLETFVAELSRVERGIDPDGSALMEAWRRLIYDATELFDVYCQLLPACIQASGGEERRRLKSYRDTVRRLRGFCATLCNRMKHEGAQLGFLWAVSPSNGLSGSRYLVRVYRDGNSLVRDDKVHGGGMGGRGVVRDAQELAHALLRSDHAAGELVRSVGGATAGAPTRISCELPGGDALRRLAALRATRHSDERRFHDGLRFTSEGLVLERTVADDFGPSATVKASLTYEPPTSNYSIA